MADKGFNIRAKCEQHGLSLNVPPYLGKDSQLSAEEMTETGRIAALRIHVERAIERVKRFHILDYLGSHWYRMATSLVFVCAQLSHFHPRLVNDPR